VPDNPAPPYRLSWPGPVRDQLRELGRRARQRGIARRFAAQIRRMCQKLATEPLAWGEARYTLAGRNIQVRQASVPLLNITYGVDQQASVVFITAFRPMPNTPLSEV
jgi:hypothetical protein